MAETGRKYLTGSVLLSRNKDGSAPEEYFIKSVIGEGGSAVCYEATRTLKDGTVETGKLKEFYPVDSVVGNQEWYYSLERLPDGQLVPGAGTVRKFEEMCQDYLSTYRLLKQVMADNPKNEILKRYIQHGEILYGCMKQKNAVQGSRAAVLQKGAVDTETGQDLRKPTVYIWSPGVPGKGFDLYLEEVRKNPRKNPESRLQVILCVMDALTDCIKALHTAGLMHMDIKPSNFLVQYDSDFEINPNNISLFDINTLCSVESKYLRMSGTEGFCAPEVAKGRADNRSDIYSIGAMLFHAIVITKDIPDGLYRDEYYPGIARLVKNSELFLASEINSDSALMSGLCRILEKCLAQHPRKRYMGCSELKTDLDKARQRLTRILYTPVVKSEEGLSEPTAVIQKLLYEHPLYETISDQEKEINVLAIGSGAYGQKFIDVCLQAGQMSGVGLNITAVSDEPEEDRETYLRFRPAVPEFVNVNGSMAGSEAEPYAVVDFKGVGEIMSDGSGRLRFTNTMSQMNRDIIRSLVRQSREAQKEYDYVFVSLGNDRLSRSVARAFSDAIDHACPVCYISQTKVIPGKAYIQNRMYPVCVNVPVDAASIDQRLGEMAFNTHISWNDSLNIDVPGERRKFFEGVSEKDKYNRAASLAFALSVKYKLHSVEIDCSDLSEAAQVFSEQILEARSQDPEAERKFNRLVDLEHRRWLIERAIDGWTAPRDDRGNLLLEDCVIRGSVKDPVKRTHPCMVRGSESAPLRDPAYLEGNHALWNTGAIDSKLDDLDRMSVELHRCFRSHAERVKRDTLLHSPDLLIIQNLIPTECDETERAFMQFRFALKNIVNGVESYSRQYGYYRDAFRKSLASLSYESRSKIEERLAVIEHAFFPVVESNLYRNYKALDEVLIEKIPFILTYKHMPTVAMAFEDGRYQTSRNEAVFANVAAATVLSPKVIRYLYCFDQSSDAGLLIRKLDAILNYFSRRNVRTGIETVIVCVGAVPDEEREMLQRGLIKLSEKYSKADGNAWFGKDTIYDAESSAEAAQYFYDCLKENPVDLYDKGNPLFASGGENDMFIRQINGLNIPYFEFDWRHKIFSERKNCEYLKYVKDASFIHIRDMFALMNASDHRYTLPEFADDYEVLWRIYTGEYFKTGKSGKSGESGKSGGTGKSGKFARSVGNWNRLCASLARYESSRQPLANLTLGTAGTPSCKTMVRFLPEFCFPTVKILVRKLVEYGIAEKESGILTYASDTCKLELIINGEYEKALNEVFMNPQILLPYYGIEVCKYRKDNSECVEIRYNDLTVTDAEIDNEKEFGVLRQLEKEHFISQLKRNAADPRLVSFVYSSPRIKKLLTHAGDILAVHAYYDVLKTGYFDDAACGYEFSWEYSGDKNELDLVLTKGFRSIIVECEGARPLKPDQSRKIRSIADQFGTGAITVLLGNTYAQSDGGLSDPDRIQKGGGSRGYIKTVFEEKEITDIGRTLQNLMEEG